jgi:hypothetical protein
MTRKSLALLLALALLQAPALAGQRPMPFAWYNDQGGLTLGAYLTTPRTERGDRHSLFLGWSTGLLSPNDQTIETLQASLSLQNPLSMRGRGLDHRLDAFRLDGRSGLAIGVSHRGEIGASLRWLAVHDDRFLDRRLWDVGGTLELPLWIERRGTVGEWTLRGRTTVTGAVEYRRPGDGITTRTRYDMQPWASLSLEGSASRPLTARISVAGRLAHASTFSADPLLPQRRVFAAGADPYQQMANPFLRALGAPLVRGGMAGHWHQPGGGNLRGFDRAISSNHVTALNIEVTATLLRSNTPIVSRVAVVGFGDVARLSSARGVGGDAGSLALLAPLRRTLLDAGVGLRMTHTLFGTTFESRLELPFYVNDSPWAASEPGDRLSARRWVIGIAPVIR